MPEIIIALSQEDFRKLVAGRAIDVEAKLRGVQWWVRIGLKEIDIEKMTEAFRDAVEGMAGGKAEERTGGDQGQPDTRSEDQNTGGGEQRPEGSSGSSGGSGQ